MFQNLPDLTPFGFDSRVRSIACLDDDLCFGLKLDKTVSSRRKIPMNPFWVDILDIPGRSRVGP